MRYTDSPELFGVGVGTSSCGDEKCEFCGTLYNEGADAAEDYSGDSVLHTTFAGKEVCECCYEKIENEVLHRMPDILRWYKRILVARREALEGAEALLSAIPEPKA